MLSKTSCMLQENTIVYMVSDLATSMDYVDSVKWIGNNGSFNAKFWTEKQIIDIEVIDDNWLNLDITDKSDNWSFGFCLERKFSDHLQLEVDYLRKHLERWDKENEAKIKLGQNW